MIVTALNTDVVGLSADTERKTLGDIICDCLVEREIIHPFTGSGLRLMIDKSLPYLAVGVFVALVAWRFSR